jgi:hypothetical protein
MREFRGREVKSKEVRIKEFKRKKVRIKEFRIVDIYQGSKSEL